MGKTPLEATSLERSAQESSAGHRGYKDLTIIIPTLNEGRTIGTLLDRLGALYPEASVIIADDDSTDDTREIATGRRLPLHVDVLHRVGRVRGLTASVVDAIKATETPFFIVMDSDFQHPPESVADLHAHASNGSDIAVGTRLSLHSFSPRRRALSRGAQIITHVYFRTTSRPIVTDPMSGFFGGKTWVAKSIISRHEGRFEKEGFKVLVDLLKHAPRDIAVHEIPYEFHPRADGESKMGVRHYASLLRQLGPFGRAAARGVELASDRRWWRFVAVGASGGLVNEALLLAAFALAGIPLLLASLVAIEGSILWNFAANEAWTFADMRPAHGGRLGRVARYHLVALGGAAINWALLGTLSVWVFHAPVLLANLVGIAAAALWNFGSSRKFVWTARAHAR